MFNRGACAIEDIEQDSLIITGGDDGDSDGDDGYGDRVTKYDRNGQHMDMPTLNEGRAYHACGSYRNTNNQRVYKTSNFKQFLRHHSQFTRYSSLLAE